MQLGRGNSRESGAKDLQAAALTNLLLFFIENLQTSDFLSVEESIRRKSGWKSEVRAFSAHRNRAVTTWREEQARLFLLLHHSTRSEILVR